MTLELFFDTFVMCTYSCVFTVAAPRMLLLPFPEINSLSLRREHFWLLRYLAGQCSWLDAAICGHFHPDIALQCYCMAVMQSHVTRSFVRALIVSCLLFTDVRTQ